MTSLFTDLNSSRHHKGHRKKVFYSVSLTEWGWGMSFGWSVVRSVGRSRFFMVNNKLIDEQLQITERMGGRGQPIWLG